MNRITTQNLQKCMEYSYNDKISASEYASLIRFLVMTINKQLPIELLDNTNDKILKVQIINFEIDYKEAQEGEADNLTINYKIEGEENQQTLSLINTGKDKVSKDSKSGSSTFYRYYVYAESNEEGYRVTFNRRVTKK